MPLVCCWDNRDPVRLYTNIVMAYFIQGRPATQVIDNADGLIRTDSSIIVAAEAAVGI